MKVIVTGGAGLIGSAVVRDLFAHTRHEVLVIDKLTYAGNLASLDCAKGHPRYRFSRSDICDRTTMARVFSDFDPDAVMHLAAETHVDRSIDGPGDFIHTNVVGTYVLLETALAHWRKLGVRAKNFRFLHISTDEVFGALDHDGKFTEETRYDPRSPYSASKAASDHLVRAWGHTYGLPVLVTNCSNNYGPYQFPEKLIPLTIIKGLTGKPIPIYGKGYNVRDWLFVDDHARALALVMEHGRTGETYNIGGNAEHRNIDVVHTICDTIDGLIPIPEMSRREMVTFVADRPGHDFRYAIDFSKLNIELGWSPQHSFEQGLAETVKWYIDNRAWWEPLVSGHNACARRGLTRRSA